MCNFHGKDCYLCFQTRKLRHKEANKLALGHREMTLEVQLAYWPQQQVSLVLEVSSSLMVKFYTQQSHSFLRTFMGLQPQSH